MESPIYRGIGDTRQTPILLLAHKYCTPIERIHGLYGSCTDLYRPVYNGIFRGLEWCPILSNIGVHIEHPSCAQDGSSYCS